MARPVPAPEVVMLDVGQQKYGDCLFLRFGRTTVLVDGAHPGDDVPKGGADRPPTIREQLADLVGGQAPHKVSLLIVTHAHLDHIGCLPALVKADVLRADWALIADPDLGWGRTGGGAAAGDFEPRLEVRRLAAALREEPRADERDNRALAEFITDAATLEDRYLAMIAGLERRGTKVVRYTGEDSEGLSELLANFDSIGLEILGPTRRHLEICAEAIQGRASDAIDLATQGFDVAGPSLTELDAYRAAILGTDASSGLNPAINNQSLVTVFRVRDKAILLSGDMQLAKPQTPRLNGEMATLRRRIFDAAPFDFAKLGHHGSSNAVDASVLDDLKDTPILGISTGSNSKDHPNEGVLTLLRDRAAARNAVPGGPPLHFARTDHNGQVRFRFGADLNWHLTRPPIDDPVPNPKDDLPPEQAPKPAAPAVPVAPAPQPQVAAPRPQVAAPQPQVAALQPAQAVPQVAAPVAVGAAGASDRVEIHAWVPHVATRVVLTVDVQPQVPGQLPPPDDRNRPPVQQQPLPLFTVAPGRKLPKLLFVTSRAALDRNLGAANATCIIDSIRADPNLTVWDSLPAGLSNSAQSAPLVCREVMKGSYEGVVILGGYDVVPAQRLDALTAADRQALNSGQGPVADAPDRFYVWSDGVYGDANGDGISDLPVSRIPDAHDPALVMAALASRLPSRIERCGIRNVHRPFADTVFKGLQGSVDMLSSQPHSHTALGSTALDADLVYFMLHGGSADGTQFLGETAPGEAGPVAFDITSILNRSFTGTVFSGCCYGALTVDEPAVFAGPGRTLTPKTPDKSIALAFLKAGARAFVGCTGVHYSPINRTNLLDPPDRDHFGGPLHRAFWRHHQAGTPPALALRLAKKDYVDNYPYLVDDRRESPIASKTIAQFTCLGLGW